MVDYIIRAALAEETSDGWIWVCGPSLNLASRTVVLIKSACNHRGVYTEVRKIDKNFLRKYNSDPYRLCINESQDTIVMAEWYRIALAIDRTTNLDRRPTVPLTVKEVSRYGWGPLRAACHHPNLAVRLGTRLGVLGIWLGLLGAWLGLIGVCNISTMTLVIGFVFLGIVGLIGVWASWGPPRPRLN